MKKILLIIILCTLLIITQVKASLPLSGKNIIIDVGHGGIDAGTSYQNILEKLEQELTKNGASVILTRDNDYDLSSPNADRRKKSDFDNRIKLINNSKADIYLSIHINYLEDSTYSGAQVFYYSNLNKPLAEEIQKNLNTISYPRSIKTMPNIYMYRRLKKPGVLIECGFISNPQERQKLTTSEYQTTLAQTIAKGVIAYFT